MQALHCGLTLLLLCTLKSTAQPEDCLRRFTGGGADCGSVTDTCTLDSVDGPSLNNIDFPPDNMFFCYRTCYVNGEQGDCIATLRAQNNINPYVPPQPMYTAMKFSSPHYHHPDGIGNYRKSNICRYHVKCDGTKLLYYGIVGQSMQDTANCSGISNVCVDKIRLIFPGVGECERCSTMSNSASNCMDRSGLGNEIFVEFTANRETDLPGFEMFAYCVEPGFSQNILGTGGIGKREAEQCTSPNGIGPRELPALPPPDDRLQRVLELDPNAIYRVLEESEDRVTYRGGILLLTSTGGVNVFQNIISLEVESPIDVRRYFRIAPGEFTGFAQLVISEGKAFLVQFGINPNLQPTEEENTIAALLDAAVAEVVSGLGQFDVLDPIDLLEQSEDVRVASNATQLDSDTGRKKRGIEPGFIEALSREYSNACNGVLRTSASVYQQVVLGIGSGSGEEEGSSGQEEGSSGQEEGSSRGQY